MSTHKHINKICVAAIVIALIISVLLMNGSSIGIQAAAKSMGYEDRLFSANKVHTIDIVIDDWDAFLSTAQSEEYSTCSVVIDGEAVRNVGIRGKGNTSLSAVASMDSERYSFKIEFDHYDSTKNYHGLDKLCLNNIIQDNTYMKDYLVYQMMNKFGVASPLCSYAYITVNGEAWGLYLAVEAIEEAFLQRNYGSNYGELYKPDSMSFGGGRGNGKNFKMDNFGGMGSSDVKLQYIDDDPDSYANIFDNAKTDITKADQTRLISSLKQLSEYENLSEVINIDEVLRYFVVHNFVVNGDSYTGSMIHNYYLYEENGQLSMIPWDYNLAFGTFQGGSASSSVNDDIDDVLSDRPMQAWIFSDESYSQQYYALYSEMLAQIDIQNIIDTAYELIAPYVKMDPTAFCTYEEFQTGAEALKEFCTLRTKSVQLQLDGSTDTVDTANLNLSDMGTMNNGMDGFGGFGNRGGFEKSQSDDNSAAMPPDMQRPDDMQIPGDMKIPEGMQMPDDMEIPEGMQIPNDMEIPEGMQMPGENNPSHELFSPGDAVPSNLSTNTNSTLILITVSVLFLAVGLLIAYKFKR